jgi:hypothetical protein
MLIALFLVILLAIALPLFRLLLGRRFRTFAVVVATLFVVYVVFYFLAKC